MYNPHTICLKLIKHEISLKDPQLMSSSRLAILYNCTEPISATESTKQAHFVMSNGPVFQWTKESTL